MTATAEQIDRLLPQTQCRECGYSGCLPYARALAEGSAAVNLCAPGGVEVMHDLARLLAQTPLPPAHTQPTALEWLRAYKAEQEAKSPPLEKPAKKAV